MRAYSFDIIKQPEALLSHRCTE